MPLLSRAPVLLLIAFALWNNHATAQAGVATLGFQLKPVVVMDYFDPSVEAEKEHLRYSMDLQSGFAFGMSVRVGITNTISMETGLGSIRRSYDFRIANDTSLYDETGRIRYTGYELPITGLVYIRLGERTWMNTALGASLDFYPGDVEAVVKEGSAYIFRRNWAQASVLGNLGVEYRTPKSGTIYVGATYHRPFNDMALADLTWNYYGPPAARTFTERVSLNGSYLTVDLRYYFHEDPDRAKLRRQRNKKG
ncbi:MAG: hypothetical protein IPG92_08045 [Flavobacteriales bacterium]|nr:hypothetical protein [Flavobacteriales bacterium]